MGDSLNIGGLKQWSLPGLLHELGNRWLFCIARHWPMPAGFFFFFFSFFWGKIQLCICDISCTGSWHLNRQAISASIIYLLIGRDRSKQNIPFQDASDESPC